jgi:phosphatidylethanolamine/phosphatidyl-N-methylethanolamine N-methyltransferase
MDNLYEHIAPIYDILFAKAFSHGRSEALSKIRETSSAMVLEIGIGTGLSLLGYEEKTHLAGIDISNAMLKRARRRSRTSGPLNTLFCQMDANQLAFADDSFDSIVILHTLAVVDSPQRLLDEAMRVCKPNGCIIIVNHFTGSRLWRPLELVVAPMLRALRLKPLINVEHMLTNFNLHIESVKDIKPAGLFKMIVVRA